MNGVNLMQTPANNQMGMVEESRQLSEIKGKIFLAKQFPRDENLARERILSECKRTALAEAAVYTYQRGTSEVKGPSIRLAEVVARHWGNFDSGVVELEQRNGESTVKTYAWDLESNYRDEKIFTVKHLRDTKKGTYELKDSRDIYERVANDAARRKRACILAVIPGYIFDEAMEICEATLKENVLKGGSIEEVRANTLKAFQQLKADITEEHICTIVGKNEFDKISAEDITKLRHLYTAINDGFVKIDVAFGFESEELPALDEDKELDDLNAELGIKQAEKEGDN